MNPKLRIVLLGGCLALGALHLPSAKRVLGDGLGSPAREVHAMERTSGFEIPAVVAHRELVAGGRS